MDVSPQAAHQSLAEIKQVMHDTRRAVAARGTDLILMLWGVIWFVAFSGSQFWPRQSSWIWTVGDVLGVLVTIAIATSFGRSAPVRIPGARQLGWRIFAFWCGLSAYSSLWLFILPPTSTRQVTAFITTVVMFAYVVLGLWFESWLLAMLGAGVTAMLMVGYLWLPEYFYLWMAVCGGGALFASGLYIRLRWR